MRTGVTVQLSPEDRVRLNKLVADRNTPKKHAWRAEIVLLTADGVGTMEITRKRIRRGVFKSVTDLEVAIYQYLAEHNDHPKPFIWTATTKDILERVARARVALKAAIGTK